MGDIITDGVLMVYACNITETRNGMRVVEIAGTDKASFAQ
jgi:hypothetical protein